LRENKSINKRTVGSKYEQTAGEFLIDKGYRIIAYNYRCKLGEIDIIALDGDELVFVEVKYRASSRYGSPMEAVDYRKQNKIYMVANYYLMEQHISKYTKVRFDVVGILGKEITLIKNAFGGM
jgi:putative endonuclease